MKESVVIKLENLVERFAEVQALLGDPDTISNQEKFRALSIFDSTRRTYLYG